MGKLTKRQALGWLAIVVGLVCLPHLLVLQCVLGGFWIKEGLKMIGTSMVSPETPSKDKEK